MSQDVVTRLEALTPLIKEILSVSGLPGATIGIVHHGETVYTKGFGFRDVENKLVSDENTIYYLSSLSKSFTASMICILVEQGKLSWTTPISKILPSLNHPDSRVQEDANILDFLAHRTGLAPKNNVWNLEFAQAAMGHEATMPMINSLEKMFDLRAGFQYSNWGYAVADEVILALCDGMSFGEALQHHIFDPLALDRIMLSRESELGNRAEPYQTLSNGDIHHLPMRPSPEDGTIMQGAVGVQSCVKDLLKYYRALLSASKD